MTFKVNSDELAVHSEAALQVAKHSDRGEAKMMAAKVSNKSVLSK